MALVEIEQKAKAYDEAIERAKRMFSDKEIDYLFPELQNGKGERIKNIIYCLIRDRSDNGKLLEHNGISVEEALDWLERQGEKKPAWSEEDENRLNHVIKLITYNIEDGDFCYGHDGRAYLSKNETIDFLKSLKERYALIYS